MESEVIASFRSAVNKNDVSLVSKMLSEHPLLAIQDLRPSEKQDHFTNGYAIVEASSLGHLDIVSLLLQHGADPNAQGTSTIDPPEFGVPICRAVENHNYDIANLLLDHGASTHAFPYCDRPMIEKLFNQARIAGVDPNSIRKGLSQYLGDYNLQEPKINSPKVIHLYYRALNLGVEPSLSTIVRDKNISLIGDLLKMCPEKPSPKLSYPPGTVFENIVYNASWYGYPEIMEIAMKLCPHLFTAEVAKYSIYRAIISHNRDGLNKDYILLIKTQLDFLQSIGKLDWLKVEEPLYPYYELAKHFLNKDTYSCKAPLSTSSDLIEIAKVFLEYGFDDFHKPHPVEKLTPIEMAKSRLAYQGMVDYIDFIESL